MDRQGGTSYPTPEAATLGTVDSDWASPADAAAHFAHRLAVETDVSDV